MRHPADEALARALGYYDFREHAQRGLTARAPESPESFTNVPEFHSDLRDAWKLGQHFMRVAPRGQGDAFAMKLPEDLFALDATALAERFAQAAKYALGIPCDERAAAE